ncbi:hypothetical protein BGW38_010579 [Lunasporangiospora selenospora]|uniref:Iron complex transport system substrate-binding protein n=1 Tax=Lunasporangiospora selenospora TaxID=979761 RepID=A0A9P6KFG0_9FUNG|nr:hypothetical protein BGW38_010579 [Lunasporangiospora selenospora]
MAIQAFRAIALLLPALAIQAVAQGQGAIGADECVTTYDANVDYFASKISVDDAALFKVSYHKNYKVVTNVEKNLQYVLTQCGTPVPSAASFPNTTVFVNVPVKNTASMATTSVAFIEMLGRRSTLKVVDTEGLVSSPCVQLGLEKKEIVGLEDTDLVLRAQQLQGADVIFSTFGVEKGSENKTVIVSDVRDPGPLHAPAQNLTANINNNYNCFKSAANAKGAAKPIVAWTQFVAPASYNNNTASWTLSGADYKRILSTDAGATFFNGTDKSSFLSPSEFHAAIKDVDVIIDETMTGANFTSFITNYNFTSADEANYKFLKNKAVFRQDGLVNPGDGRDWFAGAVVMNDAVLQDIVRAVHPEVLPASVHYNWIRNIAKEEPKQVLTSANCTAVDATKPVPDRALVCKDMKAGGNVSAASTKSIAGAFSAVLGLLAVALTL